MINKDRRQVARASLRERVRAVCGLFVLCGGRGGIVDGLVVQELVEQPTLPRHRSTRHAAPSATSPPATVIAPADILTPPEARDTLTCFKRPGSDNPVLN